MPLDWTLLPQPFIILLQVKIKFVSAKSSRRTIAGQIVDIEWLRVSPVGCSQLWITVLTLGDFYLPNVQRRVTGLHSGPFGYTTCTLSMSVQVIDKL